MQSFDFTVAGTPRSAQAKSSKAKDDWKSRVASSAKAEWSGGENLIAEEVSATIVYFFEGDSNIDVDNIAKPILDALADVIYVDDLFVSQLTVRRTALTIGLVIRDPSPNLAAALVGGGDFVYIRLTKGPDHGSIP